MKAKLILMRHGKSVWNQKNLFTGWVDIPLAEEGVQEALDGGKKIRDLPIDVIFTSTLTRAHMTLNLSMLNHSSKKTPVFKHEGGSQKDWASIYSDKTSNQSVSVHMAAELNERYYGELQGLNKAQMAEKYGKEQVHIWRRSFDVAPPGGESLKMTSERALPYFQKKIIPFLEQGKNVFICAHGNSLRSIIMDLDKLSPDEVTKLEVPTGDPIIYTFDEGVWIKN